MRITVLCFFLLASLASFGSIINNCDGIVTATQATDSASKEPYSLSLDVKNEKLYISQGEDSLKLYGIKIFSNDGKELISKRIDGASKSTAIDISTLPDGEYIIHLVNTDREIVRSTFVLKR